MPCVTKVRFIDWNRSFDVVDISQGELAVTEKPIPLTEGELYVVQNGQLQHVERAGDLPKVPVSKAAKEALLNLRRGCRRALGGFRPDIALVASALIEHAAALPQAQDIVQAYAREVLSRKREPDASSEDGASS